MSYQLHRILSNLYSAEKEVIRRKEKLPKGNRTGSTSMIPKPKGCPGRAGPDSYNVMNAMKLSKAQYNLVAVRNNFSLFGHGHVLMDIQYGIRALVAKYLDVTLPISKQSNKLMIEKVIIMVSWRDLVHICATYLLIP